MVSETFSHYNSDYYALNRAFLYLSYDNEVQKSKEPHKDEVKTVIWNFTKDFI